MKVYRCGTAFIIAANAVEALKIKIANGMAGDISPFKTRRQQAS